MRQLSGQDASFIYMESARTPMHIGALSIYDPATAPAGRVRFKQILSHIEQRLHLARAFRQRLLRVPLEFDFPYWIDDRYFDLEYHVRHIALPAPGDWRQLCIQVARLHSRILDLSRPLWEFYVIEGLDHVAGVPPGSYAILSKIHHAAVDGVASTELTASLHDPTPDAVLRPVDVPWHPESEPSPIDLIGRAVGHNVVEPFKLLRVLASAAPAFVRAQGRLGRHEIESSGGPVPRTRFNRPVSAHRIFEGRTFDLAHMKAYKNAVPGATVNDAVVALCGGALRHYLSAHGELPESSLVAMAPINVRTQAESGREGNRVAAMTVRLRSDVEGPVDRLAAVHASTRHSKAVTQAFGARAMTELNRHVPAATLAFVGRLVTRWGITNAIDPIFNTIVTNVPGPQQPLYMNGARLVTTYGLGPVVDGMGLFLPVLSYAGGISIAVTACRELMPDPDFFGECIERSFADALSAVGAR